MDGVVLVEAPLRDVQQQVSAVERRLVIGGVLAFAVALLAGAPPPSRWRAGSRACARPPTTSRAARSPSRSSISKQDEIGDLARSLEEMRTRLDALERARSAFIANASHELRTPLTALGGYLELLTEGGLTEAERSEFLETMGEQVQRLTKLATDLLDLSRLDAGGLTIAHDELELGELAADSAREMQALAARRGSSIVVDRRRPRAGARRRGPRAAGAARARRQRAAPHAAGLDRHAEHRDDALGRERRSSPTTGPGSRRSTSSASSSASTALPAPPARGTGLGLAIARELAERMDGRLLAASGRAARASRSSCPGPAAQAAAPTLRPRDHPCRSSRAPSSRSSRVSPAARWRWRCGATAAGAPSRRRSCAARRRRRSTRSRSTRGARNGVVTIESSFGVDEETAGSGFVVDAEHGADRDRVARRHRDRRRAARPPRRRPPCASCSTTARARTRRCSATTSSRTRRCCRSIRRTSACAHCSWAGRARCASARRSR